MSRITGVSQSGIYTDLMRKFRDEGHSVFIVSPNERSLGGSTELLKVDGVHLLKVRTLNLQKTNVVEKGLGQVMIENQYKRAINVYFKDIQFDLILYTTPPITFPKVIAFLKKRNSHAITYLLLKDIFPQNAIDIGLMSKTGLKGIIYNYFRNKEKKLYMLSDYIGCMSPANVDYVLSHNSFLKRDIVEIAPNSLEFIENSIISRDDIRRKYNLPVNTTIFIYGGNLGKPQGIPFIIECLQAITNRKDCHFLIVGSGTELPRLKTWVKDNKPQNVTVMDGLPKGEYIPLVQSCDVGLIFLDHRFTIPNYPSRLLSYLSNRMPILCATDINSDIGRIAEENGYGYWCESSNVDCFVDLVDKILRSDLKTMGRLGYEFFLKNYQVEHTYKAIVKHIHHE